MSEIVSYSKKQMNPVLEKLGIDPSNEKFIEIISLFADKPNYQVWAVKAFFSESVTMNGLKRIAEWSEKFKQFISSLKKKNLVAYKTRDDFNYLMREIRGAEMVASLKYSASKFNTAQRKMMEERLHLNTIPLWEISLNSTIVEWYDAFKKWERLPFYRKEKFISLASGYRDVDSLLRGLRTSVEESYNWDRDDMMAYVKSNTPDCQVVFDENDIVVLEVPSFNSAEKLCGGGRTGWCITRGSNFFEDYAGSETKKQFFVFNFNKPETDELAHIGFTIDAASGITAAHSTKNQNMLSEGFNYRGRNMTINAALDRFGIKMGDIMGFKKNTPFEWSYDGLEDYLLTRDIKDYNVIANNNGAYVMEFASEETLNALISHTCISKVCKSDNKNEKFYLYLNFDEDCGGNNSICLLKYKKDLYGEMVLEYSKNLLGASVTKDDIYKDGMTETDVIGKNRQDPSRLIHKYIDENNEDKAIDLMKECADTFNPNEEFLGTFAIYQAIRHCMDKLFAELLSLKKCNINQIDGFEETVLSTLLRVYLMRSTREKKEKVEKVENMIRIVLERSDYDFEAKNMNLESPIHIACLFKECDWVVDALLKKGVCLTDKDDYNMTPFMNAIRKHNEKGIMSLMSYPSFKASAEEIDFAKRNGYTLPTESASTVINVGTETEKETKRDDAADLFYEIFNTSTKSVF